MSKNNKFILDKKEEIEIEKLETGTCINKSAISSILTKSKNIKKDDTLNKNSLNLQEKEKEVDNRSNYSIPGSIKTSKEKKIKISNFDEYHTHTFNSKLKKVYSTNSELERFEKKQIYSNDKDYKDNLIKRRLKEFVPTKECEDLLKELDEEDEDEENRIENNINIGDTEQSEGNNNINNYSEDQKLKYICETNEEPNKIEEKDISVNIRNIFEDKKCDENINVKNLDLNKNIDMNVDFDEPQIKNESKQSLNPKYKSLMQNYDKTKFLNFLKKRDFKFKKEFYDITYTTYAFFKEGKYNGKINEYQSCILLIRKHFLYALKEDLSSAKTKKDIKFLNPDISLLYQLHNHEELDKNNYEIKKKYNISNPLLCLNFNLLSCILLKNKNNIREFIIMVLGSKISYSFIIDNKEILTKFIFIIQSLINNAAKSKINRLGLSLRTDLFYKNIYMTVREFESIARTGDLLLFRTDGKCPKCQRFYTGDQYDHVGIVIRKEKKLFILESTSFGKCNILYWNDFTRYSFNLVYIKLAYRKLNYENKDKMKEKVTQKDLEEKCNYFLDEIRGKDYYLSIPKFMCMCCKNPEYYENDKNWEKAKGFCCSALAAAMYFTIGVINMEKSVHSVKPGDFEQDRNCIVFNHGYSLGPEKIIEFSE